jgi:hypothetical protein
VTYPVILPVVVIDAANKSIRFVEGSTTETVTLAEGSYFLRGDGQPNDLLVALCTALDSNTNATNANTYSATITRSIDPDAASGVVSIDNATGSSSFSILWADALTTVDPAWFGFAAANTAHDGSAKVSTLSPSAQWVSPQIYREWAPEDDTDVAVVRTRSGAIGGGRRGGPYGVRRLEFSLVHDKRTHRIWNTADPAACFSSVHGLLSTTRRMEIHFVAVASGYALDVVDVDTRQGDYWHLSQESAEIFTPRRLSPGTPLESWAIRVHESLDEAPAQLDFEELGNVDIWADIQGFGGTPWPAWSRTSSATLDPTLAPNGGSLGGYWATVASGPDAIIESYTTPPPMLQVYGGQFRQSWLSGLTTETASVRQGAEQHYAARVSATVGTSTTQILPGLIVGNDSTTPIYATSIGGAPSVDRARVVATFQNVFWGWDAGGAYLQVEGGAEATGAFTPTPTTEVATPEGLGFVSTSNTSRNLLYLSWARTKKAGAKAAFQAWFAAQFS